MIDGILNAANVLIFATIIFGIAKCRNPRLHVRIMTLCMILDILLLLVVEISQKAIAQAVGQGDVERTGPETALLVVHIIASVAMLIWWFVQLRSGRKILKGQRDLMPAHGLHAKVFITFRLVNVVTAFFV